MAGAHAPVDGIYNSPYNASNVDQTHPRLLATTF